MPQSPSLTKFRRHGCLRKIINNRSLSSCGLPYLKQVGVETLRVVTDDLQSDLDQHLFHLLNRPQAKGREPHEFLTQSCGTEKNINGKHHHLKIYSLFSLSLSSLEYRWTSQKKMLKAS